MKKRNIFLPITVFAMLFSFGLAACSSNPSNPGTSASQQQQEKITISAADGKTTIIKGQTVQLTPSVDGVSWSSSDDTIATVSDSGLVTSLKDGNVTITAKKDGYKDGTIKIKIELQKINITAAGDKTTLIIGETVQLQADQTGVTWKSSDSNIASVEGGLVTAKKAGTATISAEKDDFRAGTISITVNRPAATKVLHMEDAEHYTADGTWGTSYSGTMYGPGDESPVYERSSGNASDGTCIAYMDNGDKETLTFSSSAATKAELVLTMASRNAVTDMGAVFNATLNGEAISLNGLAFEGGGDTNTFVEFSLGDVDIKEGNNVLEFDFKASSPYFDDLSIYAENPVTIEVVMPVEKDPVTLKVEKLTIAEGKTAEIESDMSGLSYKSGDENIAKVDDKGVVTGIAPGDTTIAVSKDGYKTVRLPVTITEAEGVIKEYVDKATGTGFTTKSSQNLTAPYNTIIDTFDVGGVMTFEITASKAGTYSMSMKCRASGGYNSSATDDLATCLVLKINDTTIDLTTSVSGSTFTEYALADVTLKEGKNTVTFTCVTTVPSINYIKFVPKA